jgi:hypothetical protein
MRSGSKLRQADPEQIGEEPKPRDKQGPVLPTIPTGWVWLAMSRDGSEIAAAGGDRAEISRWRGDRRIPVPFFGTQLVRPTYDRHNILWAAGVDPDGRGGVWGINTAANPEATDASAPRRVLADWLANRRILALRVSPGGERVAVISTNAQGTGLRIDVAGVVRAPNGIPQSLARPLRVAPTLTEAKDLVWTSETGLAILGRVSAKHPVRTHPAEVGGALGGPLPVVAGAASITTAGGSRLLVVTTDGGEVFVRAGNSWLPFGEGSDFAVAAT